MTWQPIAPGIAYWPATEAPLSADVGAVFGARYTWLYDVGASREAADALAALPGQTVAVLSHFHADHTANLPQVRARQIYGGAYTCKKLGCGTAVTAPLSITDGVPLVLFPLPSVHAKGSLGLEVDGRFAFVGDALYGTQKDGRTAYNVSLLHETIRTLEALRAERLLVSHCPGFVRSKAQVLAALKELYRSRTPGRPFVFGEVAF